MSIYISLYMKRFGTLTPACPQYFFSSNIRDLQESMHGESRQRIESQK